LGAVCPYPLMNYRGLVKGCLISNDH
jgi:hypothetical protein